MENQTNDFILTEGAYINSSLRNNIQSLLTKRVFIAVIHLNQYAEGITGQNHNMYIFANDGRGYDTKKEAREVFKELNKDKEYKTRIVRRTPYGNIGDHYTIKFVTGQELFDLFEDYRYSYYTHHLRLNKEDNVNR
jgi:hypothetical protein